MSVLDGPPSSGDRVVGYSTIRVTRGNGISVTTKSLHLRKFDERNKTKGERSADRNNGLRWERPGGESMATEQERCNYKYNDVTSTASFEVTDNRTKPPVVRTIDKLKVTSGKDTLCSHSHLNTLVQGEPSRLTERSL